MRACIRALAIAVRCSLLLSLLRLGAQAQTRAWLDRDRIALGETVTLNIETDAAAAGAPDYAPLQRDFELSGHASSRQYRDRSTAAAAARTLYAVALQPRRDGVIDDSRAARRQPAARSR